MKIIKAKNTDSKGLTELTLKSKAYWGYSLKQIDEWRDDLTINAKYIETNEVYSLIESNILIGYYSFFSLNKREVVLDNIFVDPKYIGKGYGKILMNHFLQKAKGLGFEKVSLHSEPNAEFFYTKIGFKVIGQLETSIENRFLPIMELEIKNNRS
jgi:N-acetylglutamate synthase-like GNAT family acetyltransferase